MSNEVTRASRGRLPMPPSQKSVWMCLADHANDEGVAWPSIPTISNWTSLGQQTVIDAMKVLEAAAWLRVQRKAGSCNHIYLNLEKLRAHADPSGSRTGPGSGPVREPDHPQSAIRTTPVREPDPTRPAAGPKASEKHQGSISKAGERAAPKRRIPDRWEPNQQLREWALQKQPALDLAAVVERFRDYHISRGEPRASWDASFRTWVSNESRFGAAPRGHRRGVGHSNLASQDFREGVNADGTLV